KDPARRFPSCLAFVRALYQARPRDQVVVSHDSRRPKTMLDTLENISLEELPEEHHSSGAVPVAALGEDNESVSNLGVTVAQPFTGALRPTLVLGIGGLGRRALMELRCRMLDRFGDLGRVPILRFLYIDSDPEAIKISQRGAPEVAFSAAEVYHLPLQPV